ncbi:MAG: sigma-54-dependent transcriptional regulator [Fidelibacterota bacterium]
MKHRAVIIEDEKLVAWSLGEHLRKLDYDTITTEFGEEGVQIAMKDPPELLFVDYRLPDINGIDVLKQLQPIKEDTVFFFMTAYGTTEISVEALKLGAFEYLNKPLNFEEITVLIKRAIKERQLSHELTALKRREDNVYQLGSYISKSESMQNVMETIKKLVHVESGTILLLGETGTGKDTLARVIHEHSPRRDKPFIVVNCASLSENLLESELFGHERGAFTDAKNRKLGQVELAHGGTVYLDEIGEIPIGFQAKLLRFIETQSFYRVGGTRELKMNVRIIASTNRDLKEEIKAGNFREDLYFRLNIISLTIPPLRNRKEDIPFLINRFIEQYNEELSSDTEGISEQAMELLKQYHYPGNVRELKNIIERIFLLEKPKIIEPWHLPSYISRKVERNEQSPVQSINLDSYFEGKTFAAVEQELIEWALKKEKGNQSRAAKRLNITRDQIRYKIKKYHLS